MVKKNMFNKIKLLKRQGFNIKQISDDLKLDRKTVSKYYRMSERYYKDYIFRLRNRTKVFDEFKEEILNLYEINSNKKLNTVSVYDYLEEKNGKLPATERTLRNYIDYLIITEQLVLETRTRMYSKVPELPFGKQMQLDFGQYKTKSGLKLYIFAAVLSASRYKYVAFQEKPFTTLNVILHILNCFDYFHGIVEEIVIDQDNVMVVSENRGDIIYTKDFKYFIDEMGLKLYVCRKNDPESKGKIENVIKYVKNNFLQIRDFNNLNTANESVKKWLVRRGNGKISQATGRIPGDLIEEERKCLKPIQNSIFRKDSPIRREDRDVSDKSYISVNANQYSVPVKYKNRKVEIYITKNRVFIFNLYTGKQITEHELSFLTGQKIRKREHFRENERKLEELKVQVENMFELENWNDFLQKNFKRFSRYVRDQCIDAKKYFLNRDIDIEKLDIALKFCIENKTYSFSNLNDTYRHYLKKNGEYSGDTDKKIVNLNVKKEKINVRKRKLGIYKYILNKKRS